MPPICRVLLLLLCSGCTIPVFEHPLVAPDKAQACPELHGGYGIEEEDSRVYVSTAGDGYPGGCLRVLLIGRSNPAAELSVEQHLGFTEKIGRHYVLHLPVSNAAKVDLLPWVRNGKWDAKLVQGYMLVRLTPQTDRVEMSYVNDDFIEKAIRGGRLAGRVVEQEEDAASDENSSPTGKSITVTASTAELRKFFETHINGELFHPPETKFVRAK